MMPFCNFQDTVSAKILYGLFLQKDSDGNVLEFIADDMLNIGGLFEDEDDETENKAPRQEHPLQPIQISQGFLYCAQTILLEEKEPPVTPRVFGSFVNDGYKLDFSSFIFHPPGFTS
ncbi:MAG: hypothetical protein ABJA85_00190 [Bacteroidota bacterium]